MIYVYDAPNGQWHGFEGNILEYQSTEYRLAVDWCKENNVIIHFRDEDYIDALKPELPIVYHNVEESFQRVFNKNWHPPLIRVKVCKGLTVEYKAVDNYSFPVIVADSPEEFKAKLIDFFSDNIVFRMI